MASFKVPTVNLDAQNKSFALDGSGLIATLKKSAQTDLDLSGMERKEVCDRTELDNGFLSRILSEASPVTIPAKGLVLWTREVGPASLHAVAAAAGFRLVRSEVEICVADLSRGIAKASLEAALLGTTHAEAMANDGRVDEDERAQLHAHALRLLDEVQALVTATRPR